MHKRARTSRQSLTSSGKRQRMDLIQDIVFPLSKQQNGRRHLHESLPVLRVEHSEDKLSENPSLSGGIEISKQALFL